MKNSKIEWTHHTVNLWWGCTKVHAGCDNCYAETLSKRYGNDVWGNDVPRMVIKSAFKELEKIKNIAERSGGIHRVFVGSMMDIFEKTMPLVYKDGSPSDMTTGLLREALFILISKNYFPNLMFLFLTKRPSNINKYIPDSWKENPPDNVMFGCSPCDQKTFNQLVPQLLEVKGKRFLSIEPQLETVSIRSMLTKPDMIHWIIQGGESGGNKRPFNSIWAYSMREQCKNLGIPYFFKQIDKVQEIPSDLMIREFPNFMDY